MSMQVETREIEQLHQLYKLREKRALQLIAEQRVELERVQGRLDEQRALVQSLRDELESLHQLRSKNEIKSMTALSLRAESDRRNMLTQELEMEDFYLPGFLRDVKDAKYELAARQRNWARTRDRIKGLKKVEDKNQRERLKRQSRLEDALLDDRPTQV
ncbi:MAG: hypothetical protein AB8B79_14120 [Granulosicoccus sp.]